MGKIISFLYHEVTDTPSTTGFQRPGALPYTHSVNHFLSDLNIIQNVIASSILVDKIQEKCENSLMLTFDDGGSSALFIAKTLSTRNLVGHFFVTTSMIGTPGFLIEDEIREINSLGHLIGTHSHTHPSIFRDLSLDQMLLEWKTSKAVLENILNVEVISASVPGGDMNDDTIKSAGLAGLKYLFTSEPSYRPYNKHGVKVIGRVCTKNTTQGETISAWSEGRGLAKEKIVRYVKEIVRRNFKSYYDACVRKKEGR